MANNTEARQASKDRAYAYCDAMIPVAAQLHLLACEILSREVEGHDPRKVYGQIGALLKQARRLTMQQAERCDQDRATPAASTDESCAAEFLAAIR